MFWMELLILISDVGILYFVYKEYSESKATNKALTKLMNKQRKSKQKVSVDRIIKEAVNDAATN